MVRIVLTLVVAVSVTEVAYAQNVRQNFRVAGTVRAADGAPLPGAVVSVVGTTITATTDAAGRYE